MHWQIEKFSTYDLCQAVHDVTADIPQRSKYHQGVWCISKNIQNISENKAVALQCNHSACAQHVIGTGGQAHQM